MASSSSVAYKSGELTDRKRVLDELTRGREFAERLRVMLRETRVDPAAAQALIAKIMATFTHSLSVLGGDFDEVSQVAAEAGKSPVQKLEYSGESCKKAATAKERRGCYKRRKNLETCVKDSPNSSEDGFAWRKYGQKVILSHKHPRNYFRCTHKFDQGCQASKQVQQIQDVPPLFRTTYHGHHTCKNKKSPHHIIIGDATQDNSNSSSIIWSFQSKKPNNGGLVINDSIIKQEEENKEQDYEIKSSPYDHNYIIDTSNDHLAAAFSSVSTDHGDVINSSDVYSCTASTHSMDMDMDIMVGGVFGDFFDEFETLSNSL